MSQNNGHAHLIAEGQTFLEAEEWQQAADAFAKVLETNPSEHDAVDGMVRALVPLKNIDKVKATLTQALTAQTDDDDAAGVVKSLELLLYSYKALRKRRVRRKPTTLEKIEPMPMSLEGIEPLLDKVLAQFPKRREVLREGADLLFELKKYPATIEAANQMLELDKNDADALYFKATAQHQLGKHGDAGMLAESEKTILAAIAAHPDDNWFPRHKCAEIYFDKREYDKAFEYMWQWKGVRFLRTWLDKFRWEITKHKISPAEGERFFDETINRFPQELSFVAQKGWFYSDQEKHDLALASFIKGEDASSTESFINGLHGQIAAQEVEKLAAEAVKHFSAHAGLRYMQATLFYKRKKYAEAVEACDKVLEIEPENFDALLTKCTSLRMQGRAGDTSKFDEAERTLEEVLKKPEALESYWLKRLKDERGQLHYERGQYREAYNVFIESENFWSLQNLFYWMGLKGFGEEAERLLQTAESRFPKKPEVLRAGAQLYYAQGLNEEAAKYVNTILEAAKNPMQKRAALLDKLYLLRLQSQYAEAEAIIREELRENANNHDLLNELGSVYFDQLQYGKALEQFSKVLSKDEHHSTALPLALASLRGLGRGGNPSKFKEAEEMLAKVLPIFPEDDHLLLERGWLYYDQGNLKEADETFSKAAALAEDPRAAQTARADALLGLKRGDEAIKLLNTLKQRYPNDAILLERAGWYYMGRNDLENAKKEFDSILSLDRKNIMGLNGLASIHFAKGEFQDAEEKYRKVLELAKDNLGVQTNLAWALVRQGDNHKCEEAGTLCRSVIQLDPYFAAANACLGVIAFRRGNSSESEDYLIASTRNNSREGGYSDLGALYVHMARYEEAEAVLKTALDMNPYDAQALIQRGYLYLAQEKPKEAVRELRRAAVVDKWGEESARMLATALMRAGEYGEAERVLRDALKRLDANRRWQLHLRLSELLIRLGDEKKDKHYYEDALVEAAVARRLNNADAEPYFHEGIALAQLKEYRSADNSFIRCLKLKADHYDAQRNQRIVRAKIREQRDLTTGSWWGAFIVGGAAVVQLVVVWGMYLKGKISETTLIAMIPLLLGLIVVSLLLRTLVKLKLPGGFEAEVTQTQQTESLSAGPQGGGFSISSSPGGAQR